MKTSDYDYELPERLIAQHPVEPRDHSRLLAVNAATGEREHRRFDEIVNYLRAGDALVLNETRVIPARLLGVKEDTGVPVEVLLLRRENAADWEALVKPGRRLKPGAVCVFGDGRLRCEILGNVEETGGRRVRFHYTGVFEEILDQLGEMPLPPYIHEQLEDRNRYQTVYARVDGSAAAPTAGLHLTPQLLERIRAMGVEIVPVLLHVGLGTFRPVKAENLEEHVMHSEWYQVTPEAAERLNRIRAQGGRIFCVGTTSVRTLETVAKPDGTICPGSGETAIFIHPGVPIKAVDGLITNFHLPQSTLLMLVSAFLGRETALDVYREAVAKEYRFFSFGDAMLIYGRKAPYLVDEADQFHPL